jgi:hypothetical protein
MFARNVWFYQWYMAGRTPPPRQQQPQPQQHVRPEDAALLVHFSEHTFIDLTTTDANHK